MLQRPTAIDLFAGAGGATQGLVDAGYTVLAAIEKDNPAARTYRANHPTVRMYERDIQSMDPAILLSNLGIAPGDVSLLKACPPCQGFSTLGKNAPNDKRNDLILEVWRYLSCLRPRSFLFENVPGLRHDLRLRAFERKARAIGYGIREYVVDASSFGVPQRRHRLIVLGVHGTSRNSLPSSLIACLPSTFDSSPKTAGRALALASGLDSVADPIHRHRKSRETTLGRIRRIPVGGTRFDLPESYQLPCHKRLTKRHATSSYGRIRLDAVAPTMTSRCTTPACGSFVHPTEHRGITLREASLIQTFPLNYRFEGTYDQIERQIGNALPVKVACGLGLLVAQLIN